ncbi:MAG: PAS domain-containing protein, partial [Deltaproteobacteria bacterium]|nr:PAS domain-containing protein [Deltaproteobacteria bacterium]
MPQLSPTLATALETTVWTWLHRLSEATTRRWAAFAFAALVCIIAIALPQVLGIAHLAQFRFFYPAVLIAAYVSGRAGGLAATTFSAIWLTAGLFWNGARPGMGDLVSLAIFTGTALLISVATTDVGRREASRRTQVFIENTPAAVAMLDRDLRYLGASRRFIADFRLPFSNLEGRHHYEVFPEIPERWREACRRCLEVGTPGGAEEPFPRADGSIDFIRWEVRPWFTTARKIGGLLLFTELVTERRRESDRMVADK